MVERTYRCDFCRKIMDEQDRYDITVTIRPCRAHQLREVFDETYEVCKECGKQFEQSVLAFQDGDMVKFQEGDGNG